VAVIGGGLILAMVVALFGIFGSEGQNLEIGRASCRERV